MEKKTYIAPGVEVINIETTTMVAASIGIGNGEAKAEQSFSNERKRQWGNLW